MALVFAAVMPHTPMLIPAIGKQHASHLRKTTDAITQLVGDLYAAQPDVVCILSPHSREIAGAFRANIAQPLTASLKQFGDLRKPILWQPDAAFAESLKERCEKAGFPLRLQADHALDYGTVVPLVMIGRLLPAVRILPLSVTTLDHRTHFQFGRVLRDEILASPRRVAVIASGHLTELIPQNDMTIGVPEAAAFEEHLVHLIRQDDPEAIAALHPDISQHVQSCVFLPLLVLLGVLHHHRYRLDLRSNERPYGAPYAVLAFDLTA